jgi:chemotaxis protein methyltransferase CheR
LRELVTQGLGLAFADEQLELLASVALKRMQALGATALEQYIMRLEDPVARAGELAALATPLTVPETFFFRGEEQFRALLEALEARTGKDRRAVRVLSAGCASGEEPYSLAIALREGLRPRDAWDIAIDAFDVNPAVIGAAQRGSYGPWALRATSEAMKQRYFRRQERVFDVDPAVRALVRFSCKNLVDAGALGGEEVYDAIFCRNVLMYFDQEIARRIIGGVARALKPGGLLFLGHAETLRGLSHDFTLRHSQEAFYYQKAGAVEAPRAPLRAPGAFVPPPQSLSWFDCIELASQRIQTLTTRSLDVVSPRAPDEPSWDLAEIVGLLREERFVEALELLNALPKSSHASADVLLLFALALTNKGACEEAKAACRRLLEVEPESAGAHYLLALCSEQAGDTSGAMECARRAIFLDSTFAMAHLHLGLLAKRSQSWALAKAELDRALYLLDLEDASRILLFGGGFSRAALMRLCRGELAVLGGSP